MDVLTLDVPVGALLAVAVPVGAIFLVLWIIRMDTIRKQRAVRSPEYWERGTDGSRRPADRDDAPEEGLEGELEEGREGPEGSESSEGSEGRGGPSGPEGPEEPGGESGPPGR